MTLVLGQVVLTGGLDVQVSVDALVGELSGRIVEPAVSKPGLKTPKTKKKTVKQAVSQKTVKQALSKKAAAKAGISGRG